MIFGILRHKKYRQTRFSGSARFFVPFASFPLYPRDSAVQPRPVLLTGRGLFCRRPCTLLLLCV